MSPQSLIPTMLNLCLGLLGDRHAREQAPTAQRHHLGPAGIEGLLVHAAGPARPARLRGAHDVCGHAAPEGRAWGRLGPRAVASGGYVWRRRGRHGQGRGCHYAGKCFMSVSRGAFDWVLMRKQVMGAVDVKQTSEHELTLEWDSSASNDMIADSTLGLITGIDKSPASVKRQ